jgi:hypothetical protein
MVMNDATNAENNTQHRQVTDLLLLQQQLRNTASLTELGYFLVNDTKKIAPYQVAVLQFEFSGKAKIAAISGLPKPSENTPFSSWFGRFYEEVKAIYQSEASLVRAEHLSPEICREWQDYLPAEIIYLPLCMNMGSEFAGALILARNNDWREEELGVLKYWQTAIAYTVDFLRFNKRSLFTRIKSLKTIIWLFLSLGFGLLMFLPVSMSVMAPVEIVPKNPIIIRAPFDGVIGKIHIQPNQLVNEGDLLLTLDDAALNARLDVAQQELEIAKAEYRRAEQASVFDRKVSSNMPTLKARIEQRQSEAAYVRSLLKRIVIHAEQSGIVMIPDIHEIEGKPVVLGEKILTLANTQMAEGEIWLAVSDSITLPAQSKVEIFLNIHPETPYLAKMEYENYQAELSPEGILAFRTRVAIVSKSIPRIGLRGTAKLYGEKVPLFYYIFRRPFAVARQWIGL